MSEDKQNNPEKTSVSQFRSMDRDSLRMLVILAMLTALEVVLSRFLSINAWNLKIGFSFVPVVVAALLYGFPGGACVAALGDFAGALLFPVGPYFPGFTLTALLTGLVFGLFLHGTWISERAAGIPERIWRVLRAVLPVAVNQLILSLLLNTLWISVLYGSPYLETLVSRLLQCAILIPVQIFVILTLTPAMERVSVMLKR